jgi:peptidoglycan/xylan/chitin deacetylase (PgdA/CDA1 family)
LGDDFTQPVNSQEATTEPAADFSEPEWDGTLRRINVPILMYHYISEIPGGADQYRINLTITPGVFRQHVEYMFSEGYTTISMYDLNEALLTGKPLPIKPVILTFDDGYSDHYTHALPILQEFGFTGTFFIITARADANDPNHLNWEQIREMADAGMSMESHTKDHFDLRGRDEDFLVYQMLGSIESLEHYTGRPSRMFSFPIGHYDGRTLEVADSLPIWRAVTTENGSLHTTTNRLLLPRVRISNGMGAAAIASLLRG